MTPRATLCAALALALVVSTTAFSLSPSAPLQLRKQAMCSASSQFVGAHRLALAPSVRAARPPSVAVSMSIFGLGAPELVIIAVVGALIFGPKNLAGLGKDLGKVAGSLKAEASTFSEAMNESLNDAKTEFKEDKAEMAVKEKVAEKPATPAATPAPAPAAKKVDLTDE